MASNCWWTAASPRRARSPDAPVPELELRALDQCIRLGEKERRCGPKVTVGTRQSGAVYTSSVGRFATNSVPSALVCAAVTHRENGDNPTVRFVPGPRKTDTVERSHIEQVAPHRESCQMCAPGADRIPFIESGRDGDCPPQSIDIRDAEDGFRPGRIGSAGDGPSHMIRAEHGHDFAHEIERHRCGKPFRVGALHQPGVVIASERDDRRAVLAPRAHTLQVVRERHSQ